MTGVTVQTPGS